MPGSHEVPPCGRDCAKTRMVTMCPPGGCTKSELGAVATGSFPRCSTTAVITKSCPVGKNETIAHAYRPGRYHSRFWLLCSRAVLLS